MSYQSKFAEAQFVSTIADIVRAKGITLHIGTNFEEYAEIVAEHRSHQPLGAPFDHRLHDLGAGKGFWIVGHNQENKLIHTQAVRLLDLDDQTLGQYLTKNFRAFPPTGIPLDMEASNYTPGPAAHRIKGRVCYHGDVWLEGGENGYRGTGISSVLARYALASALMTWSPDYMFAFMPQVFAFKGLAEREGYMHTEPGALEWHYAETDDVLKGYMIYMDRYDLDWIVDIPVQELVA